MHTSRVGWLGSGVCDGAFGTEGCFMSHWGLAVFVFGVRIGSLLAGFHVSDV